MTLFIYQVGLPSALYERPGQNERSVLNQVFLLLFRCLKHIFSCFSRKAYAFHEKRKMSFRVITKYIGLWSLEQLLLHLTRGFDGWLQVLKLYMKYNHCPPVLVSCATKRKDSAVMHECLVSHSLQGLIWLDIQIKMMEYDLFKLPERFGKKPMNRKLAIHR